MFTSIKAFSIALCLLAVTACTRIPTGEVGVRVDINNQIASQELQPGSWNQTMVGDVLKFPVREIAVVVENKKPLTKDNSALSDFDVMITYNINPSSVAELYSSRSKSFNVIHEGEIYLMHNFLETVVGNAAQRAVREFGSLEASDKRPEIQALIHKYIIENLKEDKLENAITVSSVQVKSLVPNSEILASATQYVKAQNDLKIKTTEVQIAQKEAERMAMLSNNSVQSIAYMDAQANMMIAQAVLAGKVNTLILPRDFKGMVNVK